MNRPPEIELMRLLHGELPPERAFELHERLAREPELAAELARLEATWDRLELPPATPAPRGFARSVAARAEGGGLWSLAPTRVRVTGFALLAAGLALGVGITSGWAGRGGAPGATIAAAAPVSAPAGGGETAVPPRSEGGTATSPATSAPAVPAPPAGAPSAPVEAPAVSAPSSTPSAPAPSAAVPERWAALGYDLPADDGSFADEGTLADDYWQAFDETEGAAGTGEGTGSGSEGL